MGGGALVLARWMCGCEVLWPAPVAEFSGLTAGAPRAGVTDLVLGAGTSPDLRGAVEALQAVIANARASSAPGSVVAACLDMYRSETRGLAAYLL